MSAGVRAAHPDGAHTPTPIATSTSSRAGRTRAPSSTAETLPQLLEEDKHRREDRLVALEQHVRRLKAIHAEIDRPRLVAVPTPGGSLVRVEALAALASEVARRHHPPQQGTRTIFRIADAVVKDVEEREAHLETDEIRERERSHGMIHAELHHGVDRVRRAHAFHDGVDR